jgi:hypothetical protein
VQEFSALGSIAFGSGFLFQFQNCSDFFVRPFPTLPLSTSCNLGDKRDLVVSQSETSLAYLIAN